MDRTDRLHALVEQLRESTPVPCSARSLAKRYGVSVRTVLRDISMLQQAGVPISASIGRQGGYVLEQARALPPITVTQGEAIAVVVALRALRDERLDGAARAALDKVLAVMPRTDVEQAVAAGRRAS
ncbi:putative DNA-binding transcriptional regulator YafY [Kutzneria viridogrisea]|uniref:DNA-binding transcriptional regulator YafY n=1 Tax=Kutzneria viridogrisea TaxID=47990 RepID=A0ABR6BWP5_9PSEU|nr:HTH domain-containing protein [Kutzneria albida]MBA8931339.1 putative DNA-binding transcriptional regulator YafY [Kutzneria viridogrisea]